MSTDQSLLLLIADLNAQIHDLREQLAAAATTAAPAD